MIQFTKRNKTNYIRLLFAPDKNNHTKKELLKEARQKGKLNLGVHFILRKNGELEEGIDPDYYADYELDGYTDSIYVMVTAPKLSDSTRFSLRELSQKLNLQVKE